MPDGGRVALFTFIWVEWGVGVVIVNFYLEEEVMHVIINAEKGGDEDRISISIRSTLSLPIQPTICTYTNITQQNRIDV